MKVKKYDLIIIIGLLLISLLFSFLAFKVKDKGQGDFLLIEVDGKEYGKYPLNVDKKIEVKTKNKAYNIIEIKNGKVKMLKANCRDLICTHMPAISDSGQTIVCLPHRLILEVKNYNNKNEVDKVVR